jgi:hypothetical protein
MNLIAKSVGLLLGAAAVAAAQVTPDSSRRDNWSGAFLVGVPGVGSETSPLLTTLGLQLTQLNPGRISGDFALGIVPYGLGFGAILLGVRGGVVLPMQAAPDLYLLPSAGASTIAFMGPAGGESTAIVGFNTGFGILTGTPQTGGMRFNVTWHHFGEELDESLWLVELGFVFKRRPKPR